MRTPQLTLLGLLLASAILYQVCSTAKPARSTAQSRQSTTRTEPISTVTPPPAETSLCDPNYSGCVPIASDVDCAGGKGNGPKYVTGPVKVIGKDIYKLDGDGDGIGCE